MTINEFAKRSGISVQRAATLARTGRISAHKVGNAWVVDEGANFSARSRRPLSAKTQQDFITFMNIKTLDHVVGDDRRRLVSVIRQFWASENPADLIRDWYANTNPEGKGGAALVRAAKAGYDKQVKTAQQTREAWIMAGPENVRRRISEHMAYRQIKAHDLAEAAGVPEATVKSLIHRGLSPTGNRDGGKVIKALGINTSYIDTVSEVQRAT